MALSRKNNFDITTLPDHIWMNVFSKLSYGQYCQIRLTCKHLFYLSQTKSLQKFKLKLDGEDSVQQLVTHVNKYGATLPISILSLHNINSSDDLGLILKAFSKKIRVLYLTDAPVFQNFNDANLNFLEELYIHFDRLDSCGERFLDIKCCKRLHTIAFALRENFNTLFRSILAQFIEAGETIRLKSVTFSYNSDDNQQILTFLKIHSKCLQHLNMFFHDPYRTLCFRTKFAENYHCMSRLESISLSGNCSTEWARGIFTSLPQRAPLKRIQFDLTTFNSDEILKLIVTKWPKTIKNVLLKSTHSLTTTGMNEISKLLDNLESLEIQYQSNISMMDVTNVLAAKSNPKLRQIIFNELSCISDECVKKLTEYLPNLEDLELSNNRVTLTNLSLGYIFENLKFLRRLRIACCTKEFPKIPIFPSLEELSLNNCDGLTSAAARHIFFPNLRNLYLAFCKNVTSKCLIEIAQYSPDLEVLEFVECHQIDDKAVYFICENSKKLRSLTINCCKNISREAITYANRFCFISRIEFISFLYDDYYGDSEVENMPYSHKYGYRY